MLHVACCKNRKIKQSACRHDRKQPAFFFARACEESQCKRHDTTVPQHKLCQPFGEQPLEPCALKPDIAFIKEPIKHRNPLRVLQYPYAPPVKWQQTNKRIQTKPQY